jgi:ABC-type bacteriocin/lantibiotic exporter with double-glycine peptidase domain
MKRRIALLFVVVLAACFATLAAADGVWLDVPFIAQEPQACGAASLAMVMDYWRGHGMTAAPADAPEIFRELNAPDRKGIPAEAMPRYLEAHGFTAFTFSGEWADVRHHVEQGRPLIVALKTGADSFHYAVVAGVGDATISLNDPADRKLRLYSREDFEKRWLATGQWTLLAVPVPKS